jgi:hypothetical protein
MRQELKEFISCSPPAVLKSLEHFNAAATSPDKRFNIKKKTKEKEKNFVFIIGEIIVSIG